MVEFTVSARILFSNFLAHIYIVNHILVFIIKVNHTLLTSYYSIPEEPHRTDEDHGK